MTDDNFATSVVVTPADEDDAEPFLDVMDQCEENGFKFKKVMGDSAYSNWPIIEEKAKDRISVIAKVPPQLVMNGRCPKSKSEIDTESGRVTCPEGSVAKFDSSAIRLRKRIFVSFQAAWNAHQKWNARAPQKAVGYQFTLTSRKSTPNKRGKPRPNSRNSIQNAPTVRGS